MPESNSPTTTKLRMRGTPLDAGAGGGDADRVADMHAELTRQLAAEDDARQLHRRAAPLLQRHGEAAIELLDAAGAQPADQVGVGGGARVDAAHEHAGEVLGRGEHELAVDERLRGGDARHRAGLRRDAR